MHLKASAPLPTSSTGTMLQSKQPFQTKHQTTSGNARPARSRATSTTMLEAGRTCTLKASSTTGKRSRSREKSLLSKRATHRLTQWATTPKCSPAVATTITTRASVSSFDWATVKPRSGRELLTAPVWATALSDHRQGGPEQHGEPSRSSIVPGEFYPRPTAPRGLQCCLLLRAPEAGCHQ